MVEHRQIRVVLDTNVIFDMNANALVVTSNVRDFRLAQRRLGLRVMTPLEFLQMFSE